MSTLCLNKCIAHSPTNDEIINLIKQVLDNAKLRAYLRSTYDSRERILCIFQHIINSCYLFLHQIAKHLAVFVKVISNYSCRSILTVSCTESIVYINISIISKLFGKFFLAYLESFFGFVIFWCAFLNANRLAFFFRIKT